MHAPNCTMRSQSADDRSEMVQSNYNQVTRAPGRTIKGMRSMKQPNNSLVQTGSLNSILAKSDHKNLIR